MALDTFTPPRAPGRDSQKSVQPRVNQTQFGDGYKLRAADGLNTQVTIWDLVWPGLLPDDAEEIEAFFVDHDGHTPFWWQEPRTTLTTSSTGGYFPARYFGSRYFGRRYFCGGGTVTLPARKFVCTQWARNYIGPNADKITARFEQDFTLGS